MVNIMPYAKMIDILYIRILTQISFSADDKGPVIVRLGVLLHYCT